MAAQASFQQFQAGFQQAAAPHRQQPAPPSSSSQPQRSSKQQQHQKISSFSDTVAAWLVEKKGEDEAHRLLTSGRGMRTQKQRQKVDIRGEAEQRFDALLDRAKRVAAESGGDNSNSVWEQTLQQQLQQQQSEGGVDATTTTASSSEDDGVNCKRLRHALLHLRHSHRQAQKQWRQYVQDDSHVGEVRMLQIRNEFMNDCHGGCHAIISTSQTNSSESKAAAEAVARQVRRVETERDRLLGEHGEMTYTHNIVARALRSSLRAKDKVTRRLAAAGREADGVKALKEQLARLTIEVDGLRTELKRMHDEHDAMTYNSSKHKAKLSEMEDKIAKVVMVNKALDKELAVLALDAARWKDRYALLKEKS
jgi:predicted transcriptional regulator